MIFRQIAVNILLDLYDTSTRLMADAGAIAVPTLYVCGGSGLGGEERRRSKHFSTGCRHR